MRFLVNLLVACVLASSAVAAPASTTEIMVIASMHGLHQTSEGYPYDALYKTVANYAPDFVGVEIRPEDLQASDEYLRGLYPREMIALAREYGSKAFGVDWLGDELAGRPVPDGWFKNQSRIKQLERELDKDSAYKSKTLERLDAARMEIVKARTVTPASLNDGRYDAASAEYHRQFAKMVERGPYAELAIFHDERDRRIAENIAMMLERHPGKRFVIVLGADHRGPAIQALRERFGSALRFAPVP